MYRQEDGGLAGQVGRCQSVRKRYLPKRYYGNIVGSQRGGKAFEDIPHFPDWNLKTFNDRQNMFRDLALKTWGLEQMPSFASVLES